MPPASDGCPAAPAPCGLTLAPPGTIGAVAYDNVAARLLNDDAAASLLDQPFINGTAETVILSVEVVKPTSVTATRKFEIRNATSTQTVSLACDLDDPTPDPRCAPPTPPPGVFVSGDDPNPSTPNFPVKVFELDATNSVIGEIPCLAPCDVAGTTFRFAVPPRAVDPVILKPFRPPGPARLAALARPRSLEGVAPDGDLSLVQFHDLEASPAEALQQATPGHRRMGISETGGFIQSHDYGQRIDDSRRSPDGGRRRRRRGHTVRNARSVLRAARATR